MYRPRDCGKGEFYDAFEDLRDSSKAVKDPPAKEAALCTDCDLIVTLDALGFNYREATGLCMRSKHFFAPCRTGCDWTLSNRHPSKKPVEVACAEFPLAFSTSPRYFGGQQARPVVRALDQSRMRCVGQSVSET